MEIITLWNTQAQGTKEWQTHKNTMSWHLLYQSSIISILRRRSRRTEERNKWQWGDTNVPLLCSPLSAWENTTAQLSGLAEHKPSWKSWEFKWGGCGLAIHFSLFGFVSAVTQQPASLSYRRAVCSQPVSLQPPPTNCSQPVCHRKLHFHLQATHEQARSASTWRPKTGRERVGDGCGQTRKTGDWLGQCLHLVLTSISDDHMKRSIQPKQIDVHLVLAYIFPDSLILFFVEEGS